MNGIQLSIVATSLDDHHGAGLLLAYPRARRGEVPFNGPDWGLADCVLAES